MYKNILLAIDGSPHSMRSTQEAIKIASMCSDCTVELVYVADFSKVKNEVLNAQTKEQLDFTRNKMLLTFADLFEKKDLKHKKTILHGDPGPVIVEYANNGGYDLVIMGSKGKSSLQEMVLGSVSHKVVKRANAPVLIVK